MTRFIYISILFGNLILLNSCGNGKIKIVQTKLYDDTLNYGRIKHDVDRKDRLKDSSAKGFEEFNIPDIVTSEDLIGYGFNSATLQPLGRVVNNDATLLIPIGTSSGQNVTYDLERVTSKSNLYNLLGTDVKTSMSVGPFSGDATLDMLNESSFNSYSDYLFLKIIVQNSPLNLTKANLTSEALRIANTNKNVFIERFGNEFFYSKVTGGEFACLFEFTSNSSETKKAVSASVDVAVHSFFGGGSLDATMSQLETSLGKNTSVKVHLLRIGDQGTLAKNDMDSIIKYSLDFPGKIQNEGGHPVIIRMLSKPIITVENLPLNFRASDYMIFNQQSFYLDSIATVILKIQDFNANYEYASDISNKEYFSSADIESAKKMLDENKQAIQNLKLIYDDCVTSIENCRKSTKIIKYNTYIPKVLYDTSAPGSQETASSKNIVLTTTDQLIDTIPFGQTKTIEFRGNWRTNEGGPTMACAPPKIFPPSPLIYHLTSPVRIYQLDINTGQMISSEVCETGPFITRTGVKVYVRSEYPAIQCDPPVTATIY